MEVDSHMGMIVFALVTLFQQLSMDATAALGLTIFAMILFLFLFFVWLLFEDQIMKWVGRRR